MADLDSLKTRRHPASGKVGTIPAWPGRETRVPCEMRCVYTAKEAGVRGRSSEGFGDVIKGEIAFRGGGGRVCPGNLQRRWV